MALAYLHAPLAHVQRVKAEIAIYTAGFVIMTLLINAPLCSPLMTLLKLDRMSEEQLQMRIQVSPLNCIDDRAVKMLQDDKNVF